MGIDEEWTHSTSAAGSHGHNRLQTPNWIKRLKEETIVRLSSHNDSESLKNPTQHGKEIFLETNESWTDQIPLDKKKNVPQDTASIRD
jgi:hypothetical protein